MFTSKKEIDSIITGFETLSKKIESQSMQIAKLNENSSEMIDEMDDARKTVNELNEQLGTTTILFSTALEQVNNEVVEFKLFLSKVKKELVNDLTTEFSQEMQSAKQSVTGYLDDFKTLRHRIDEVNEEIVYVKNELKKFLDISSNIKQDDFKMQGYDQVMEKHLNEKQHLQKRVDMLEKIVAKQRRIQH